MDGVYFILLVITSYFAWRTNEEEIMKRLLRKFFPSKAAQGRNRVRKGKNGHMPMILSFDGRVVRLRLPD
jgi:hypothetical protein